MLARGFEKIENGSKMLPFWYKGGGLMECPRCKAKLRHLPSGKRNKAQRDAMKRRFKGILNIKIKGETRKQIPEGLSNQPPNGMSVEEHCKSCGYRSIRTYDAGNRKWNYKSGE